MLWRCYLSSGRRYFCDAKPKCNVSPPHPWRKLLDTTGKVETDDISRLLVKYGNCNPKTAFYYFVREKGLPVRLEDLEKLRVPSTTSSSIRFLSYPKQVQIKDLLDRLVPSTTSASSTSSLEKETPQTETPQTETPQTETPQKETLQIITKYDARLVRVMTDEQRKLKFNLEVARVPWLDKDGTPVPQMKENDLVNGLVKAVMLVVVRRILEVPSTTSASSTSSPEKETPEAETSQTETLRTVTDLLDPNFFTLLRDPTFVEKTIRQIITKDDDAKMDDERQLQVLLKDLWYQLRVPSTTSASSTSSPEKETPQTETPQTETPQTEIHQKETLQISTEYDALRLVRVMTGAQRRLKFNLDGSCALWFDNDDTPASEMRKSDLVNWRVVNIAWRAEFMSKFDEVQRKYESEKRKERKKKLTSRKRYGLENKGGDQKVDSCYEEHGDCGAVWAAAGKEDDVRDAAFARALTEDVKLAGQYESIFRTHRKNAHAAHLLLSPKLPAEGQSGAVNEESWHPSLVSSRFVDVWSRALADDALEAERPVLNLELVDYETPYMMKREAMKRLLLARCRNKLDERMVEPFLDRRPDLIKARSEARAPAEVVEPLMAFRGDRSWRYDAREFGVKKLEGAQQALDNILDDKPAPAGEEFFVSAGPYMGEVTGGQRFGKPPRKIVQRMAQWRYPTLQPVYHNLPKDRTWRAHVAQTVNVLERNKTWDYESKLRAVSTLKQVYDNMAPSEWYRNRLDEKLPYDRPGTKHKTEVYEQTFPKKFRIKKMHLAYRKSPWKKSVLRRGR